MDGQTDGRMQSLRGLDTQYAELDERKEQLGKATKLFNSMAGFRPQLCDEVGKILCISNGIGGTGSCYSCLKHCLGNNSHYHLHSLIYP